MGFTQCIGSVRVGALKFACAEPSKKAYAAFEEGWRGELRPGQAADLTVFDGPLDTPEHIVKRKVLMTIVAGRVVYDARTAEPPR